MEHESRNIEAQHDGERDRMMYEEKPSFKSYYRNQLFPVKDYRDTTVCEETGRVFIEKRYRLNSFIEVLIPLCIIVLVGWYYVAHLKQNIDSFQYAPVMINIILLILAMSVAENYVTPLKYYWVKFKIEDDPYVIEHMRKETSKVHKRMVRSSIGGAIGVLVMLCLQLFGASLRHYFVMSEDVIPQILPMIIIACLVFLCAVIINVNLWKDTKSRQTDKAENMAEGDDE